MNINTQPLFPMGTEVSSKDDVCAICLDYFHGHDVAPVDADKTKCMTHCRHTFHLGCLTSQYFTKPIGSRQCAMCRQNPMPVKNQSTSQSHPDKFFPDETFYDACIQGDYDQVDKSLAEGVNINAVMKYGLTALMLGSCSGNRTVIERQLNAGAKVGATRTGDGLTALLIAVLEGKTECAQLLIDKGADLKSIPPLLIEVLMGNTEKVRTLIADGADLNADVWGTTPLLLAAMKGNTECLQLLIEKGATLETARTSDGSTPLFVAVWKGNTDCAEILIKSGANLDARDNYGSTPLFLAAEENHTDIGKLLIDAGANLNLPRTLDGTTPLFLVASHENSTDFVELLLNAGANPNTPRTSDGTTPLYMAAQEGNTQCVKLLLNAGANPNTALPDGATPLFIAALKGNVECLKLLLNFGADLKATRYWDGATALSIAIKKGNNDCAEALIKAEAAEGTNKGYCVIL
ncbi:ankyrin repeat domain-containing protein [Endozoicomonas sp. 8E]|uniref:ankyrin repeat domain-containing protein n=1 Tax=Endozoicomonas sp. 8E TaxID=3035692 RepID=UPI0029394898|nr:ankyrin repeat domain-containing protein [Endozoicomonas sp. 8E]WOG28642.1 ankyrin repeat domain-containing protein [Endozoicomonas sp. 8E]